MRRSTCSTTHLGRQLAEERLGGGIAHDDVAPAIDGDRGKRLVVREHQRGGAADGSELRGLEVALRERGREPRGEEPASTASCSWLTPSLCRRLRRRSPNDGGVTRAIRRAYANRAAIRLPGR